MYAPQCPEHRSLVFDFALGRLDDQDAMRAEQALGSCEICSAWWSENFDCDEIKVVDDAVAATFTKIELAPRRKTHRHAWAVAAAATLVIGVSALWQSAPGPQEQQAAVVAEDSIAVMDFEFGQAVLDVEKTAVGESLARMDFEPAIVVAGSSMQGDSSGPSLAAFDFESGSLAGMTPNT